MSLKRQSWFASRGDAKNKQRAAKDPALRLQRRGLPLCAEAEKRTDPTTPNSLPILMRDFGHQEWSAIEMSDPFRENP